jgi:hypothetical protein
MEARSVKRPGRVLIHTAIKQSILFAFEFTQCVAIDIAVFKSISGAFKVAEHWAFI